MSRALYRQEILPSVAAITTRLGNNTGQYAVADQGKFVKQIAESAYGLCAAGDHIEGWISSVEQATAQGFSVGGINNEDSKFVTFDGLQATPGTGTVAVGDYVVCGSVTALGTVLPGYAKVCTATSQAVSFFNWRVVSLGSAGTGAVGTTGLIERVGS